MMSALYRMFRRLAVAPLHPTNLFFSILTISFELNFCEYTMATLIFCLSFVIYAEDQLDVDHTLGLLKVDDCHHFSFYTYVFEKLLIYRARYLTYLPISYYYVIVFIIQIQKPLSLVNLRLALSVRSLSSIL